MPLMVGSVLVEVKPRSPCNIETNGQMDSDSL